MSNFLVEIYTWYKIHKRELPWRKTANPYFVWLSEIILQQTRVAQGTKYFSTFKTQFPTIDKLALATEDEVLKLWQGLGYYSRARNLHATAKLIVNDFNGQFPADYKQLLKLKGVGNYTAAAIASIAFNQPHPTVDGNIYRVLARYFGIKTPIDTSSGKKEFYKIAKDLISHKNPGMHNQALMEFGALQCVPKSPNCKLCPVVQTCFANQNGIINLLPVKLKKIKQRIRYFYFYYIESENYFLLEKRTKKDIWQNLYQLPLIETEKELSDDEIMRSRFKRISYSKRNMKSISTKKKHILSHQIIYARVIHIEMKNKDFKCDGYIRVNKKDIHKFAVPRLLEHFFEDFGIE
jgi:A/G-specific adenine glycosylase